MSKHKSGKRLTKQRLIEMLQTLFQQNPNETFSLKQIFRDSAESERDILVETNIQGIKVVDASGKDAGCRRDGRNGVG